MRLSYDLPSRIARSAFALTLAWAWSGAAQPAAIKAADTDTDPVSRALSDQREFTAADVARVADQIDKRMQAIADAAAKVPRETFDPAAVVAAVGREPEKLFQWVRSQTTWVPYRGMLRGAQGVLMDRNGNSLDRALLLAALIRSAGGDVRMARTQLSEAQATKLLSAGVPDAKQPKESPAGRAAAPADQPDRGVPPALEAVSLLAERRAEEAIQRVADQTARLSETLGKPAESNDDARAALDATEDHWWVQFHKGNDWVDFDPSAPNDTPGGPVAPAAETFAADPAAPGGFKIPADLVHQVVVRVVIERAEGSRLTEATVFEHPMAAAAVSGRRLVFRNMPLNWPDPDGLTTAPDRAARLKEIVVGQTEWAPALTVDGRQIVQRGFNTSGDVIPDPQPDPMKKTGLAVKGGVEKALDVFDTLDAPPKPGAGKAKSNGILTAVWLEFETRAPGAAALRSRRDVFDLVGPAGRSAHAAAVAEPNDEQKLDRGLALLGQSDLLVTAGHLSRDFVSQAALSAAASQREPLVKMMRAGGKGADKDAFEQARRIDAFPGSLYALALARHGWARSPGSTYVARPNVFCQHGRLRSDGGSGLVSRVILDLVQNDVSVRPGTGVNAFAARLEQGVLDTNAEALVLARRSPRVNTADLYDAAGQGDTAWVVLRGKKDAGSDKLAALPADVQSRIRQDLEAGYWAVVPPAPSTPAAPAATPAAGAVATAVAWWRVDPASGGTVGMGSTGHGVTMTEYIALMVAYGIGVITMGGCGGFNPGVSVRKQWLCLGCAVIAACLAAVLVVEVGAVGLGGSLSGGGAGAALGEMGIEGVCNLIDWGMQ